MTNPEEAGHCLGHDVIKSWDWAPGYPKGEEETRSHTCLVGTSRGRNIYIYVWNLKCSFHQRVRKLNHPNTRGYQTARKQQRKNLESTQPWKRHPRDDASRKCQALTCPPGNSEDFASILRAFLLTLLSPACIARHRRMSLSQFGKHD